MRRYPHPTWLPFGFRRDIDADRNAAQHQCQRQPQRQQQQRTVRDEPQHKHHVDPKTRRAVSLQCPSAMIL